VVSVSAVRTLVKNAVLDHVPGIIRRGPATDPAGARRVALTFDDGPDDLTPRYLDVLDELAVPATFFLIGARAAERPATVRDYLRRGHQIASHGWDHTRFTKLSRRALLDQCRQTDAVLGLQLSGRPWVRPPHGSLDATSLLNLILGGYTVAMWSVDSCDYEIQSPAALAARCAPGPNVGPGDVILLHEGQQWTLDALPLIVTSLRAAGFECVTMHDLGTL